LVVHFIACLFSGLQVSPLDLLMMDLCDTLCLIESLHASRDLVTCLGI
jgi:hypothetical protein